MAKLPSHAILLTIFYAGKCFFLFEHGLAVSYVDSTYLISVSLVGLRWLRLIKCFVTECSLYVFILCL